MPRYSGPALALGALSRAIGDTFSGATEGVQGAEDIRRRRAIEDQNALRLALEQGRFGMEQRLQPYVLAEARERAAQAPARRAFLEAETEKMRQPTTHQVGPALIERDPRGGWREVYRRPETQQEQHLSLLTDQLRRQVSGDTDLLARVKALAGNPALPPQLRSVLEAAAADPQSARHVLGQYSGTLIKPHEPRNLIELLNRANDPAISADERTRLLKTIEDYKKTQAGGAGNADFTPESLEMFAHVVADGGQLPALGMGKASTEARIKISNRAADIRAARGDEAGSLAIRQAVYKANSAALAKITAQEAQIAPFSRTATDSLTRALELSAKIDRSGTPVANRWMLAGRKGVLGDPDVAAFDYHLRLGINEVAKITSSATGGGGVVSDTARREIEETLNRAMTHKQIQAVIEGAQYEMDSRLRHIKDEKATLRREMVGSGAPKAPEKSPAPTGGRMRVVGPNGQSGTVPDGTDLSKYPGWKKVE